MKIEMLRMYVSAENEQFLALTRAGPDGFYFALASDSLLLLCDVRKPLMPALQWAHGLVKPAWIDGQCKKEVVLGFGIIDKDLSAMLSKPDELGGFTLVRLMSSGKLESQRYSASWDSIKILDERHKNSSKFEDNFMCYMFDEEYKFPRKFKHLELDYLNGHLNCNLDEVLLSKMKNPCAGPDDDETFTPDFQEILCEKLNTCGFHRLRSSPEAAVVFEDISLPSSIHEVALRILWKDLPIKFLQLAFSKYSEFLEVLVDRERVSWEFLVVPDLPQLPPFFLRMPSCRSNKWSKKVPRTNNLVGPVLPLPILLALRESHNGCPNSEEESGGSSVEAKLRLRCDEVLHVARKMAAFDPSSEIHDDPAISLADDREETWAGFQTAKKFILHHPSAFNCSAVEHGEERSVYKDEVLSTLISKVQEQDGAGNMETFEVELFDSLCPIKLWFNDASVTDFGLKELKSYKLLKKQFSKWQENCIPGLVSSRG